MTTAFDAVGDERGAAPCGTDTVFVIHAPLPDSRLDEIIGGASRPVDLGDLADIRSVWASPDCERLLVSARRDGADLDLFEILRTDADEAWTVPRRLDELSSNRNESSPTSTTDGELIVFDRDGDVWDARRGN